MDSKTEPASEWNASPKKRKPLNQKLDSISMKMKDISKAQRVIKDEKGLPIGFESFNKTDTSNEKEPASEAKENDKIFIDGDFNNSYEARVKNATGKNMILSKEEYAKMQEEITRLKDAVRVDMKAYAAQQLSEYKEVIKELLTLAQNFASTLRWDEEYSGDEVGGKEAQEIVDRAKALLQGSNQGQPQPE